MTAVPLDTKALLAAAQKKTGLSDWGDPEFTERFAQAVDIISAANMDAKGEVKAVANCLWLLTDRLRFFDDHIKYQLDKEVIEKPLIATGEPRAGTTLLHALLSVDPGARALRFWELMHPSPPPGLATADDPRKKQANDEWREILDRLPFWLISHPYNDMLGEGLPEDERTWAFDFRVITPTAWWRVPMGIVAGGLPADPTRQYQIHKMMLQAIQHGRPNKYWVLKGFHQERLTELFNTYPIAQVIWSHRDPVQVIASRTRLVGELVEGLSGQVDWSAMTNMALEGVRASIKATLDDPMVNDSRIHHVRYADFVTDPVGILKGFYQHAEVPWTEDCENAMHSYLANNKGNRYGKFEYSTKVLTDIGLDIDTLHEEFAPFRKRFGVEIENRN